VCLLERHKHRIKIRAKDEKQEHNMEMAKLNIERNLSGTR